MALFPLTRLSIVTPLVLAQQASREAICEKGISMEPGNDTEFTLPPALVAEIQAAADDKHRPVAEIAREALEGYLAEWRKDRGLIQTPPDPSKRNPAEAAARIRELRRGNILPQGMTIRAMIDEGRA